MIKTQKANKLNILALTLLGIIAMLVTLPNAHAQNTPNSDDKVKSLGEILNPVVPKDEMGDATTAEEMANGYYKKCMRQKTNVFNKDDLDVMCACTASKMTQTLSVKDFKLLYEDSFAGRDARGKMLAYAYAPCMEYVLEPIVRKDCQKSPVIKDIIRGKGKICDCVDQEFKKFLPDNAPNIVVQGVTYNRMTMNPLERFFTENNYFYQHEAFMKQCRFRIQYQADNKR